MSASSVRLAAAATAAVLSISTARAQTLIIPSTKDFVAAAAQSDDFEIVEGQTALSQSHDQRVRAFAHDMIQAHIQTSQAMHSAAVSAGLEMASPGLNGDQAKLLTALQSQRGADFDRIYLKQQVIAHQEALDVEEPYAERGSNLGVREAARSAIPVIQRHLAMAKQLRKELGKH